MLAFAFIWLIVFVIWNLIIDIQASREFKKLNETIDWINQDIKRLAKDSRNDRSK